MIKEGKKRHLGWRRWKYMIKPWLVSKELIRFFIKWLCGFDLMVSTVLKIIINCNPTCSHMVFLRILTQETAEERVCRNCDALMGLQEEVCMLLLLLRTFWIKCARSGWLRALLCNTKQPAEPQHQQVKSDHGEWVSILITDKKKNKYIKVLFKMRWRRWFTRCVVNQVEGKRKQTP